MCLARAATRVTWLGRPVFSWVSTSLLLAYAQRSFNATANNSGYLEASRAARARRLVLSRHQADLPACSTNRVSGPYEACAWDIACTKRSSSSRRSQVGPHRVCPAAHSVERPLDSAARRLVHACKHLQAGLLPLGCQHAPAQSCDWRTHLRPCCSGRLSTSTCGLRPGGCRLRAGGCQASTAGVTSIRPGRQAAAAAISERESLFSGCQRARVCVCS